MSEVLPTPNTINYVAVHHSGGTFYDFLASTRDITAQQIDKAHQERWDFKSTLGRYGGYNFFIELDGKLTQFRAIGEETAAQLGYNFNTISICLAGNFSKFYDGKPIDAPSKAQEARLREVLGNIISGNIGGYAVITGTNVGVEPRDVHPHRFYQSTECYGSSLDDGYAIKMAYAAVGERISLLQQIVLLYQKLLSLRKNLGSRHLPCYLSHTRG